MYCNINVLLNLFKETNVFFANGPTYLRAAKNCLEGHIDLNKYKFHNFYANFKRAILTFKKRV